MISRQSGSPTLVMQVDSSYVDGACEEFGIKVPKGVASPPDIKPSLEATVGESPISPEARSRYRRVPGRLAWLAQTRMDLLHYTSLLASGQSEPRPGHVLLIHESDNVSRYLTARNITWMRMRSLCTQTQHWLPCELLRGVVFQALSSFIVR